MFLLLPMRAWASLFTEFAADQAIPRGGGGDGDHVGGGNKAVFEGNRECIARKRCEEGGEAWARLKLLQESIIKIRTPRLSGWIILLQILGNRLTVLHDLKQRLRCL